MPVRIWIHDCLVHGRRHTDKKAICLDCGERAEFSHWRATFLEIRDRVISLGGGKAPARLVIDPCSTCGGQGYVGSVTRWHECEDCGGLGGACDMDEMAREGVHPQSLKPGPHASEGRHKLYERDPNMAVAPMIGAFPLCVFDWPKDPCDADRFAGREL